ncbi:sigma-70 family RNA polymerase sigma factor [Undibacterium jejuense]|uniref:Sigma-70 family RNA polymerase sigma factor n=1 Tax=Undibacterium jejuense TaxID=1344949 RepID=A0A923HJ60_9BURK|nr:sigma-70 family RNA polymerase sigma factor [Undibacterium jejuense]MBC3863165.1 sigma-70 family RNA polymerase sigma factor [Undibacterium jejuense]
MTSPNKPNNTHQQHSAITEVVVRFRKKLAGFIVRRVGDTSEAEDILQDVFYELVEAYQFPDTVEQVSAWLYQVARFRIIDRFRKKKELSLPEPGDDLGEEDEYSLDGLLPSPDEGPEAALARTMMLQELQLAIDELPDKQREVFIAHELDGQSFKDMALQTGIAMNTLLARKRYAVLALRSRLQEIYDALEN